MLDNDNVISASVSEAVEKIPTDEKDYRKCSLCFTLHSRSSGKEQINLQLRVEIVVQLPTRIHPSSVAKKITEDILHKIYTEKGTITGI